MTQQRLLASKRAVSVTTYLLDLGDDFSSGSNSIRRQPMRIEGVICRTKRNVPNRAPIRDLFIVVLPSDIIKWRAGTRGAKYIARQPTCLEGMTPVALLALMHTPHAFKSGIL